MSDRAATALSPSDTIIEIVAEYFSVTAADLKSKKRDHDIAYPRQIAMHLIRQRNTESLVKIGKALGGRDHTTITYGCKKISREAQTNSQLQRELRELSEEIAIALPDPATAALLANGITVGTWYRWARFGRIVRVRAILPTGRVRITYTGHAEQTHSTEVLPRELAPTEQPKPAVTAPEISGEQLLDLLRRDECWCWRVNPKTVLVRVGATLRRIAADSVELLAARGFLAVVVAAGRTFYHLAGRVFTLPGAVTKKVKTVIEQVPDRDLVQQIRQRLVQGWRAYRPATNDGTVWCRRGRRFEQYPRSAINPLIEAGAVSVHLNADTVEFRLAPANLEKAS